MKSPKSVAKTRKLIKSSHGFGWSISGWERNNKLITKVFFDSKMAQEIPFCLILNELQITAIR